MEKDNVKPLKDIQDEIAWHRKAIDHYYLKLKENKKPKEFEFYRKEIQTRAKELNSLVYILKLRREKTVSLPHTQSTIAMMAGHQFKP